MYMFFSFMTALVSLGASVLMVMLIVKGINRNQETRQQTYMKTLESGIYDYRLLGGKKSSGTAALGWGIFFASVGVALLFSFIAMGILSDALAGALCPLFIGVGLIIYYGVRRKLVGDEKENGEPVTFSPKSEGTKVISGE